MLCHGIALYGVLLYSMVPVGKKVSIGQQIIKKGGIGPQIKAEFRDKKQWVISQSLASGLDPPVLVLHLIPMLSLIIIMISIPPFFCAFSQPGNSDGLCPKAKQKCSLSDWSHIHRT